MTLPRCPNGAQPSRTSSNQSIVGWTLSPYTTLAPNKYIVGTGIEYILYSCVLVERAIKKTPLSYLQFLSVANDISSALSHGIS